MGSRCFRNASCEATGIYLTEHTFLIRSSRSLATQRQESAHIPANAGLKAVLNGFLARDKSVQWGILRRDPTRYHELPPYVPSVIRAIGRSQTGRQRPSGIQ